MRTRLVQFLDRLNAAQTLDAAWTEMVSHARANGVEWVHYGYEGSPRNVFDDDVAPAIELTGQLAATLRRPRLQPCGLIPSVQVADSFVISLIC